VTSLTDTHLAQLACDLESAQHRTGRWTSPALLVGLPPVDPGVLEAALAAGTVPWERLGEGAPYHLVDTVRLDPARTVAIGLVVHGWAFPPDDPDSWIGRPSRHPGRVRVRTSTVVTPNGSRCSAIRLQNRPDVIVDAGGEGAMLSALTMAWARALLASDREAAAAAGPQPARCRRDHRS
jgi:hypothetical protein